MDNDNLSKPMGQALKYLSFRNRSRREISDYLAKKGHDEDTISDILVRLAGSALVDDRTFCRDWIESKKRGRPVGPNRIRFELTKKGISREMIDGCLDEFYSADEEGVLAASLAKRFDKTAKDPIRQRKRLGDYLISRGFSLEVASRVSKEIYEFDHGSD
ncbi:MAG: regulatory protein RecX [Actinomycetota bacterium]|nr:regulatory protein RecX [Actinomycetota bacterium]